MVPTNQSFARMKRITGEGRLHRIILLLTLALTLSVAAGAQQPDYVHVRIVDCGQGLCGIISMPGGQYMVYDAGTFDAAGKSEIRNQFRTLIPTDENNEPIIALMVLSHSHEDHLTEIDYILENYEVLEVLRTGCERVSSFWTDVDEAIAREPGCFDYTLSRYYLPWFPYYFSGGEETAVATVLCGWDSPPDGGGDINTTSIVVSLEYGGNSILFTGDSCGAGQDYLVDQCRAGEIDLHSTVLIAPHHGSSHHMRDEFFDLVDPEYVVFPAGHRFGHPKWETVRYFIETLEIQRCNLFRTDWGDDEGRGEWYYGRNWGSVDYPGDDGVDIFLYSDGNVDVRWERNDLDPHSVP